MLFEKNLCWQGFLDNYHKDENVNNELYYEFYDYGKMKLFGVLFNKIFLFFSLLTILLFISQILFLSKSYVGTLVLFLLFDIFVDETFVCIPLCKVLDKSVSEIPSLKLNFSFSIQLNKEDNEDAVAEKDAEEDAEEDADIEEIKEVDVEVDTDDK